jgi:uncharacterized RDD family membrane protein YckC
LKSIKIAIVSLLACVLSVTALPVRAAAAPDSPRELFVQSAGDRGLWLAQVDHDPAQKNAPVTVIRFRLKTATTWTEIARFGGRAVSIAARSSQLAVLLDNGDWLLVWQDGTSLGVPLPAKGQLQALAADGNALWGLAWITEPIPATRPTTTATSEPVATEPADAFEPRWELLRFDPSGWTATHRLPGGPDAEVALAAARGQVLTAMQDPGEPVQYYVNGGRARAIATATAERLALLPGNGMVMLWSAGAGGAGRIVRLTAGDPTTDLQPPDNLPVNSDRAVAIASGRLRLFFTRPDDGHVTVVEQTYDLSTLAKIGAPATLPFTQPMEESIYQTIFRAAVMAALVFALIASFQRRESIRELLDSPEKPQPAPLSGRLLAGAIDLLPIFAGFVVIKLLVPIDADPSVAMQNPMVDLVAGISTGVYLLHTTLVEAMLGRTIGKMIVGLKVIGLDGQRARVGPLLLRNVLRLVDMALLGLMVFSPLRQRVGDIVAGTLVVSATAKTDPAPPSDPPPA